ncbi:MAG TPA: hypothetical protein PKA88_27935, partial [Polyangiaceae bacterium]|nr:hypothetical protein [Polyangiaceae bacterium]
MRLTSPIGAREPGAPTDDAPPAALGQASAGGLTDLGLRAGNAPDAQVVDPTLQVVTTRIVGANR